MADRRTLGVKDLPNFMLWLIADGWRIERVKGYFEALRATKQGRKHPLIVYYRLANNSGGELVHYTVQSRDIGVVRAYLKDKKQGGHYGENQD